MQYMVQFQYPREHRDAALRYFWEHGSTHYDGNVTVEGAWVATQDLVAFALVDASNSDEIAKAIAPLAQFGDFTIRCVTSIDQI